MSPTIKVSAQHARPALRVAVIGSGLSALGAIRALISQGIQPVVFDVGDRLADDIASRAASLATRSPEQWTQADRQWLNSNPTVEKGSKIPKKLVFGSDYFYGQNRPEARVVAQGGIPPMSYALGGLSAGWGAAVLPPHADDLSDWPVSPEELHNACRSVLASVPYSAVDDGLSQDFPILSAHPDPIRLSRAGKTFLNWLRTHVPMRPGRFIFGQARLLVRATGLQQEKGCQYCGQCSSGCAYGAIYKSGDDIEALFRAEKIIYRPRQLVERIDEVGNDVLLLVRNLEAPNAAVESLSFDRVFLAAGAVNSTRIVMNSLNVFDRSVELKTRGGYVLPVFSLREIPRDWPECNTQPEVFLEMRRKKERWVHVQASLENELVAQKLGLHHLQHGLVAKLKRIASRHLFVLLINYHSDHSGCYKLELRRDEMGTPETPAIKLHTKQKVAAPGWRMLLSSIYLLGSNFMRIGCVPLFPLARLNSGSYHVGCTLPMRRQPIEWNETDSLGRLKPWRRVHIIDTSVFPSLPGTTIGLLAMGNAWRIVIQIFNGKAVSTSNRESA